MVRKRSRREVGYLAASILTLGGCSSQNSDQDNSLDQVNETLEDSSRFDSGDNQDDYNKDCYVIKAERGNTYKLEPEDDTIKPLSTVDESAVIGINSRVKTVEEGDFFLIGREKYTVDEIIDKGEKESLVRISYGPNC